MNFQYTDTQMEIADMIRDFANKHIRPAMMEWDDSQKFSLDTMLKMGELGMMGVLVPTEYGGSAVHQFYPDDWVINGAKNWITNGNSGYSPLEIAVRYLKAIERKVVTGIKKISKSQRASISGMKKNGDKSPQSVEDRTVFVCYSHTNMSVHNHLHVHIKPLGQVNSVKLWSDRQIKAGDLWQKEIENNLEKASAAICLVSAEFLASDFIMNNELPKLLEAARNNGKVIIPVIVSHCDFKNSKLAQFHAINDPDKPLNSLKLHQKEKIFLDIVGRVRNI